MDIKGKFPFISLLLGIVCLIFFSSWGSVHAHQTSQTYSNGQILKYRLISEDGSPSTAFFSIDSSSKADLANLESGSYQLDIISTNTNTGVETPFQFVFKIHDEWWETIWFRLLLLLTMLLGCLFLVSARQRQLSRIRKMNSALQLSEDRLLQALHGTDSELWEWHRATQTIHLNNRNKILGIELDDELIIPQEKMLIHPDDRQRVNEIWAQVRDGKIDRFETEHRYRSKKGVWVWLRVKGRALLDHQGKLEKIVGIYSDISAHRALQDEANLLAKAFENTSEGVLILDANQRVKVTNSAARQLLGEQIQGKVFTRLLAKNDIWQELTSNLTKEQSWTGELDMLTQNRSLPVWLNMSVMRGAQEQIQHYVAVFSDISERKRSEADLRRLANYDVLTGLPNRSLFSTRLMKAIQQGECNGEKLALLFMDLDRFKHVNDSFGHGVGDALLVEAASRLQSCVNSESSLCRFGGDEFLILIHSQDLAGVDEIAETILAQMAKPFYLYGREFFITTSIGISIWPDDASQPETLIKNADLAMYDAKESGRDNFRYYSPERNAEALYNLQLEADLRKALENGEIGICFQPQIDVLRDDSIVGMEALVRWHHPRDGFICPERFIKIAESCGLVTDIDLWVLKQACIQCCRWHTLGVFPFKMSVNISAVHFCQPEFVEGIQQVLAQTDMQARHLELEITEGVLMKELDVTQKHLQKLSELGVSVAIDDFGTGYSSLAYLRHFQVNTLKIDRTFLADIATNVSDQAIVAGIVELARNLKLNVIAEGVENQQQLEQAFTRGCYVIQGFYFAKPMSANQMELYLSKQLVG